MNGKDGNSHCISVNRTSASAQNNLVIIMHLKIKRIDISTLFIKSFILIKVL